MTTNTGTQGKRRTFVSLFLDVGVPIGSYYLLKGAFGMSAVAALGWSSVVPVLRTGWGVLGRREVNALPLLILLANLVGLLLSFGTGDARLMLVKDSAVGSLVGFALLGSVVLGRPMMTATLKPWLVKGDAGREAAWGRLRRESGAFRRAESRFSAVWGVAFVAECALRVVGVYTFPVDTMVWLGTVVMILAMVLAFVVSGALGAGPMAHMVGAAAASARAPESVAAVLEAEKNSSLTGSTHG
ncbi:VC0807 family protein [Streptomyces sp. AC512_CC834]|uniref:VC0807 family protein n=1 Tax=Streptomyces sp. AC512_CC834 TaxID=2823691 RepID=UPI001C2811E3|nr:VC0807 family protein [Streptomyces sp. AC512_CC834]